MNKTMIYILGKLPDGESTTLLLASIMKTQAKCNKKIVLVSMITLYYIFISEKRFTNQKKQIEKISRELKELKQMKGE